jgi:hypothetical protein
MGGGPRGRETEDGLSEQRIGAYAGDAPEAEGRKTGRVSLLRSQLLLLRQGEAGRSITHVIGRWNSRDPSHGHGCVDHADECVKDFPVDGPRGFSCGRHERNERGGLAKSSLIARSRNVTDVCAKMVSGWTVVSSQLLCLR